MLTGADFWSLHPEPDIGLRRLVVSDGPAGVRGELWEDRDPSANVPSPTALAASWDTARVERIGLLLAGEARAKRVDVLLAPTVNLHRTPYGGVGATVKHFVANDSETERFTLDACVDERTLRELYLALRRNDRGPDAPAAANGAGVCVGGRGGRDRPDLSDRACRQRGLLGDVEPGGRLPMTWPASEGSFLPSTRPVDGVVSYDEGLFIGYRAYDRDERSPLYAFGHGLAAWLRRRSRRGGSRGRGGRHHPGTGSRTLGRRPPRLGPGGRGVPARGWPQQW